MSSTRSQNSGSSRRSRHSGPSVASNSCTSWQPDPRARVDAVGHRPDRQLLGGRARPERREHPPRDLAVQLADGVDAVRRAHGQGRHVELRAVPAAVVVRRRAPGSGRGTRRGCPRCWPRCVSTSENGNASWPAGTGVCVVNTVVRLTSASAWSKFMPCSTWSQIRCSVDERRVALVEVPDGRLDAHRLQRAHAAQAEDDFLLDAGFLVAAVEARRQLAVPRRVLLAVRVEQEQLDVAGPHQPDRRRARSACPSGTSTTQRSPSGVMAGSIGASAQSTCS